MYWNKVSIGNSHPIISVLQNKYKIEQHYLHLLNHAVLHGLFEVSVD